MDGDSTAVVSDRDVHHSLLTAGCHHLQCVIDTKIERRPWQWVLAVSVSWHVGSRTSFPNRLRPPNAAAGGCPYRIRLQPIRTPDAARGLQSPNRRGFPYSCLPSPAAPSPQRRSSCLVILPSEPPRTPNGHKVGQSTSEQRVEALGHVKFPGGYRGPPVRRFRKVVTERNLLCRL